MTYKAQNDIIIIQIKKGQPQGWKGGKDENN
nr:MAG TPA: hypothetical protein [Bacteriophage sp.]